MRDGEPGKLAGIRAVNDTRKQVADSIEKVLGERNSVQVRSLHEETVGKRQMRKAAVSMDRLRKRSIESG